MTSLTWRRDDGYLITTDQSRFDLDVIHGFLRESYWSPGIPRALVETAMRHSESFGIFDESVSPAAQVGYARVVTDYASFDYLADVFVLPEHRGKSLSKWLMECIGSHPRLQGFRRWMLATRDAHGLYAQFGFTPLKSPERFMEREESAVYQRQ